MIKIYYPPWVYRITREYLLIQQGLVNNPRVELVDSPEESDYIFQLYYTKRGYREGLVYPGPFPPEKTVILDYHDRPGWFFPYNGHVAYFKRSWTEWEAKDNYTIRNPYKKPFKMHPLTFAIMDEFMVEEDIERDVALSCTLRKTRAANKNINRDRVMKLLDKIKIPGESIIGEYNRGSHRKFNDSRMKDYFRLLKRSRIVVTCSPGQWEGDYRIWEALANGALVFVDKMYFPLVHSLVDGKHCIFYEPSDQGLMELWKKILYFIQNQDKAESIAKEGHKFAMKYHRASNRIDEILEVITKQ